MWSVGRGVVVGGGWFMSGWGLNTSSTSVTSSLATVGVE